jgi:hypothetical protein
MALFLLDFDFPDPPMTASLGRRSYFNKKATPRMALFL